jgi:hypothetical protein
MAPQTPVQQLKAKAQTLYALREEINRDEEKYQESQRLKKAKRDLLQDELIKLFKEVALDKVGVKGGNTVTLATRAGFEIRSEVHAMAWARKVGAVSIDRKMFAQLLSKTKKLPGWVKKVDNEYISVRKPKEKKS